VEARRAEAKERERKTAELKRQAAEARKIGKKGVR
jgi:hypothetical protein